MHLFVLLFFYLFKMTKKNTENLKLENQLCFPLYQASRLMIKAYTPLLNKLKLTYPQYLVLMVLWETDEISIKEISSKIDLDTNTLTPLLKRMEKNDYVKRIRSKEDERIVNISLTEKGKKTKNFALKIPTEIFNKSGLTMKELQSLKSDLDVLISNLHHEIQHKK